MRGVDSQASIRCACAVQSVCAIAACSDGYTTKRRRYASTAFSITEPLSSRCGPPAQPCAVAGRSVRVPFQMMPVVAAFAEPMRQTQRQEYVGADDTAPNRQFRPQDGPHDRPHSCSRSSSACQPAGGCHLGDRWLWLRPFAAFP